MTGPERYFSEDLWGSLVEYLTVYAKDDLRFMLPCEVEITTEEITCAEPAHFFILFHLPESFH